MMNDLLASIGWPDEKRASRAACSRPATPSRGKRPLGGEKIHRGQGPAADLFLFALETALRALKNHRRQGSRRASARRQGAPLLRAMGNSRPARRSTTRDDGADVGSRAFSCAMSGADCRRARGFGKRPLWNLLQRLYVSQWLSIPFKRLSTSDARSL